MNEFSGYAQIVAAGNPFLYSLAVLVGGAVGWTLIYRDSRQWEITRAARRNVFLTVIVGSLVGCALPAFVAGGFVEWQADHYFVGPKTIVGGLLFGFLFTAVYKRLAHISFDTSDAFVRGTILMMAIGRVGCFAAHCCFGAVSKKIGIDFGDGQPRVPIQLIEAAFLFALFFIFTVLHQRNKFEHRRLFIFFVVYGIGRFVLEIFRAPISSSVLGINFYQWISLLLAAVGAYQIAKRERVYARNWSGPVSLETQ